MNNLSIIIPTRNEADHISSLVNRIHTTLSAERITYEIIIIDDHSEDGTYQIVEQFSKELPITLEKKKGKKGKAFSLMQGFKRAKYDLIATIDADLQYPPEIIPEMITRLQTGADIVITERNRLHPSFFRNAAAQMYKSIFVSWLNKMPYDVNSGLKLFKTKILNRVPLNPDSWTFDIEFLIKSTQAGYRIKSVPIDFKARKKVGKRKSNHKMLKTSYQMAKASLNHKFSRSGVYLFDQDYEKSHGRGFHYDGKKFVTHNQLNPHKSALYRLHRWHVISLAILAILMGIGLAANWHTTILLLFAVLTILYFADLLFNLYLIARSFFKAPELSVSEAEMAAVPENKWPTYTIFCPLYKEPEVIPQFVTAISKLSYPQDKLQVMLLLEADDTETINKAKMMNLPKNFEIRVVPDALPKTKPKACNYGLLHATGEFVVIYDAEDVPDPYQLKKAVLAFNKAHDNVICIQAKLNFYNPHQNILTRVFTAEYSLWFDLVLTGMQSISAPIPLGGTSNHFRTRDLIALDGWDSFNVTEDCDLGMRLVKNGYRTAILDSTTLEEANSDLVNWFWQRSRWIKGYMQSYLVHMRDPQAFVNSWMQPHAITFQLIVGGKILSMLVNPMMWTITVCYFVFRPYIGGLIDSFFPPIIFYMAIFSLVFGNFLYLYYYMIGCAKRNHEDLIKYAFFVPLYWLAMSLAAYMAFYKLITAPHHWSKTKHGLHLNNKKAMEQTQQKIGRKVIDETITEREAQPAAATVIPQARKELVPVLAQIE